MHVEIDQSGKIADTQVATVLAFSNAIAYSIYLPAVVKRELLQKLRTKKNARVLYFRIFSVLLFLLLKEYLRNDLKVIEIDVEYQGWESEIKGYFLNIARKHGVGVDPECIHFTHIGKKSRAHTKAINSLRKGKGDRTISFEDVAYYFLK